MNGWMDVLLDEWAGGWIAGRTDGRTDELMDEWMYGLTNECKSILLLTIRYSAKMTVMMIMMTTTTTMMMISITYCAVQYDNIVPLFVI